jgi:hypothetical protein
LLTNLPERPHEASGRVAEAIDARELARGIGPGPRYGGFSG